jgi:hypothetical protein
MVKERDKAEKAEVRKEKAQGNEQARQDTDQRAREREAARVAKETERAKLEAEKEAERKTKKRMKGFAAITRLPVARHDKELERLAERLGGEDVAALREAFEEFLGAALFVLIALRLFLPALCGPPLARSCRAPSAWRRHRLERFDDVGRLHAHRPIALRCG